jgi:hypothetical protein
MDPILIELKACLKELAQLQKQAPNLSKVFNKEQLALIREVKTLIENEQLAKGELVSSKLQEIPTAENEEKASLENEETYFSAEKSTKIESDNDPIIEAIIDASSLSLRLKSFLKITLKNCASSEIEKVKNLIELLSSKKFAQDADTENIFVYSIFKKGLDLNDAEINTYIKNIKNGSLIIHNAENGQATILNLDAGEQFKIVIDPKLSESFDLPDYTSKSAKLNVEFIGETRLEVDMRVIVEKAYLLRHNVSEEVFVEAFNQSYGLSINKSRAQLSASITAGSGSRIIYEDEYFRFRLKGDLLKISDIVEEKLKNLDVKSLIRLNVFSFFLVLEIKQAFYEQFFKSPSGYNVISQVASVRVDADAFIYPRLIDPTKKAKEWAKSLSKEEQNAVEELDDKLDDVLKKAEKLKPATEKVDDAARELAKEIAEDLKTVGKIYDTKIQSQAGKKIAQNSIVKIGKKLVGKLVIKLIPFVGIVTTIIDVIEVGIWLYEWYNREPTPEEKKKMAELEAAYLEKKAELQKEKDERETKKYINPKIKKFVALKVFSAVPDPDSLYASGKLHWRYDIYIKFYEDSETYKQYNKSKSNYVGRILEEGTENIGAGLSVDFSIYRRVALTEEEALSYLEKFTQSMQLPTQDNIEQTPEIKDILKIIGREISGKLPVR